MKLYDKFLDTLDKYNMLEGYDTVVVGVSGGADSMCLLSLFNKYSRENKLNIVVAHVNHMIRGDEAKRDADFVRTFCDKNGLVFRLGVFDVPKIALESKESLEECGRKIRYDFFYSLDEKAAIATAHNLDDSLETFLFNLSRGTALRGLTGIPPVRGRIIRPLSFCERYEIEEYLRHNDISYIDDSTNATNLYSRNKIRHIVVPVLREINPSLGTVFGSCINSLKQDDDFLSFTALNLLDSAKTDSGYLCEVLSGTPQALRFRALKEITARFGCGDASYKHIVLLDSLLNNAGAVELPGGYTVRSDAKQLFLERELSEKDLKAIPFSRDKFEYLFMNKKVILSNRSDIIIKQSNNKIMCQNSCFDISKAEKAVFRTRRPGDKFKPLGYNHRKKLSNLMWEKNITERERDNLLLLARDNDVLWCENIGVSAIAFPNISTEEIYSIEVI